MSTRHPVERIEEALHRCESWIQTEGADSGAAIRSRIVKLQLDRVRDTIVWLAKSADWYRLGLVWRGDAGDDTVVMTLEETIAALIWGDLYALNVDYQRGVGDATVDAFVTVFHEGKGRFVARGYTELRLVEISGGDVKDKLSLLLEHWLEIEARFGGLGCSLELAGEAGLVVEL